MNRSNFKCRFPGHLATGLCILITSWWAAWGVEEMFFEGWYQPLEWLFFLLPGGVCLALTLVALTWPRWGGWLLVVIGGGLFALWMWHYQVSLGVTFSVGELLTLFAISGGLALVGGLFLFEGRRRRSGATPPHPRWWRRNLRYLLARGWGYSLFGAGLFLNLLALIALKGGFGGEIEPVTELVKGGIYAWERHPVYVSFAMTMLGLDVLLRSASGALITIFVFLPSMVWRARLEERALVRHFGEAWHAYAERVPSLLLWDCRKREARRVRR